MGIYGERPAKSLGKEKSYPTRFCKGNTTKRLSGGALLDLENKQCRHDLFVHYRHAGGPSGTMD